ncbi:MAG TPA: hypothetical protein VNS12_11145 [Pelagibacterium sp.]|uniref:hypothetical protein n=1 Tax=Pelagibacterium sp. TaxID=1967288 RepID=UPI002CFA33B5|nr:hypothetical protein [Pelagibacterium sp.]HWJ88617.1 hypothetical protein [Pelagibacterium sp.]
MRIFLIAAGLVIVVLALLGLGLSAAEFGIVMLGGALVVAIIMFFITRRRYQRMSDTEKDDRTPPGLP